MFAAYHGRTATVIELVRLGADIDAKDKVWIRRSCTRGPRRRAFVCWTLRWLQDGWTALLGAALEGHNTTVVELVRLGADVNTTSEVRACGQRLRAFVSTRP